MWTEESESEDAEAETVRVRFLSWRESVSLSVTW